MVQQTGSLQLTDADVTYVLTLLRNATAPMTTAELIEALRVRNAS